MLSKIKEMLQVKAPLIEKAFQSPVEILKFSELESLTLSKLPTEFKSLYLSSNGFKENEYANLFYGFSFSSIEKIISKLGMIESSSNDSLQYADKGIKREYTFSNKRIPFGDDNGTSLLCIDLDPTEDGTYGQVILLDYDMNVALKLNNSIQELVDQFEEELENNKYSLQEDALEDGVHWLEPIRELDPINWFNSPRWQYVNEALKNS
ncbi:MAG: Unknown protein [uncultured Sulfurovum sp.]|uniref:Knr4/Smi1-like domain-containing protein n=1 Tax=uncultured Sulfurovum sp. TaxID=269237 RepID=A0A6S6UGK7_9BACT|nr:MAG: Unknown protein [uncultured Sulfurovum sp.]